MTIPRPFCVFVLLACCTGLFSSRSQTLDPFNPGAGGQVLALIPETDGKTLLGGYFERLNSVARTNIGRVLSDGSLDSGLSSGARMFGDLSFVSCITVKPNGQILVGGNFFQVGTFIRHNLAQFNPDGSLDTNFFDANIQDGSHAVTCVIPQPDGRLLICGDFDRVAGQTNHGIVRLNVDGTVDPSFNSQTILTNSGSAFSSIALQPDGKIVATGSFTNVSGSPRTNICRLNPDGSLDTNFVFAGITVTLSSGINCLSIQPDGKILAAGLFTTSGALIRTNIFRLNADGSPDTGFFAQPNAVNSGGISAVLPRGDGKIIMIGDFTVVGGTACTAVARLTTNGALDTNFDFTIIGGGGIAFTGALQADGRILAGGLFGVYSGTNEIRGGACRIIDNTRATQSLANDGTNIVWLRGGASPEVLRTTFEYSMDGTNWTLLGTGSRISGGWQLVGAAVPTNYSVRATGFVTGGTRNGSSYLVQTIIPQTQPQITLGDGHFGFRSNYFGFNLTGTPGSTVVVDGSTNVSQWTALATNILPSGPSFFQDTNAPTIPKRYYRVHF